VYAVAVDELSEHIQTEKHDCGFHLLMAPNKNPVKGLTSAMIRAFLDFYFSFPQANRMYAEPDVNNLKSIALLEKAGFQKVKTVQMSYKQAHIYSLKKNEHESK
jgi:RimJ/RimL family protein N-acetyltransferase